MDIESLFLLFGMYGFFLSIVFLFYVGMTFSIFFMKKNEYDLFIKIVGSFIFLSIPAVLIYNVFNTFNIYVIAGFIFWTCIALLNGVWNPIFRHFKNDKGFEMIEGNPTEDEEIKRSNPSIENKEIKRSSSAQWSLYDDNYLKSLGLNNEKDSKDE